jgi:tRNA (guanine37-N1)-methyltransferase
MKIDILTIFPAMFEGPFAESILRRAAEKHLVDIHIHDLRQWATDPHRSVDDRPYGGGPGMVMLVEPIHKALLDLKSNIYHLSSRIILTSAKGTLFDQTKALELSKFEHLIFIAGHYEGVDQRVADHLADEELSIGKYVLTGGELPVMVITDAVVRLLPGVVGDPASLAEESHQQPGYLEYPQYTRPEVYKGWPVPKTLLSGNHASISDWRKNH